MNSSRLRAVVQAARILESYANSLAREFEVTPDPATASKYAVAAAATAAAWNTADLTMVEA